MERKVMVRPLKEEDIPAAAESVFEGFGKLHEIYYGRREDFPSLEAALGVVQSCHASSHNFPIVAECEGKVIGFNNICYVDGVGGVGPIGVHPSSQGGVGRALMQAVLDHAKERGTKTVRLMQEAHNRTSYSLYIKLGFEEKDQMAFVEGIPTKRFAPESDQYTVRRMKSEDVENCGRFTQRLIGVNRETEIADTLHPLWIECFGHPNVAVSASGDVVGYLTCSIHIVGHGLAASDEIAAALVWAMTRDEEMPNGPMPRVGHVKIVGRLNPKLLYWALHSGMRLNRVMTLMSTAGDYTYPPSPAALLPGADL
eukprot:TRINITY_DN1721_c0_g1_i2.p1 TRINITY_DN1721_c0_g1~~TRINITY_DN1721_c0_g1_i2.p1  ORF type:complete len:312 (+),score=45.97 TRINITY_DN1721_c0_g1_i2:37-972(+)